MITPSEKVMMSLRNGHSDSVPFTMYSGMVPQCRAERDMRNRGMCIVDRSVPVVKTHTPNVKTKKEIYVKNGKTMTRTHIETPVGKLTSLQEAAGYTTWTHEKLFKSPDDYKVLLFLIKDEVYEPSYDALIKAEKAVGGDIIFRSSFGLEPLQTFISGTYIDMQDFCIEWMDNRDEILKLYDATVENRRKIYPLIAKSPVSHANYGGNVVPAIIGLETFEKYYVQHYNEAAEIMHRHGKLIGTHLDDNCRLIAKAIGETDLDYIEAFTPAPDTDMTLAEARKAWPDKVLWLNFPSSVHLKSDAEVEQTTFDLLDELDSVDGIIMGITENIPEDRWQNSCTAIMDGLSRHALENQPVR
jgi:hypothetical protein